MENTFVIDDIKLYFVPGDIGCTLTVVISVSIVYLGYSWSVTYSCIQEFDVYIFGSDLRFPLKVLYILLYVGGVCCSYDIVSRGENRSVLM